MTHAQSERSTDNKNLARFFLEQKHVAWVSLAVAILWGLYGLLKMPQRKDPDIPVRQAMIIVPWQGTSAEQVEQLVTRKIEQAIALNQCGRIPKVLDVQNGSRSLGPPEPARRWFNSSWQKRESTTETRNWTTSRSGWTLSTTCPRERDPFCTSRTLGIRPH